MRTNRMLGMLLLPPALLLGGCESEEPAVQESGIDEGGVYEDGALEQVQPVEPEVVDPDVEAIRE